MQDYVKVWKSLANSKQITARYQAQYCILRAINSKAETLSEKIDVATHLLRRAFPPATNTIKLANGRTPYDTVARYDVNPFWGANTLLGLPREELLTPEQEVIFNDMKKLMNFRKSLPRWYSYFFTRQDIYPEYQLVQTAHAALELGTKLSSDQSKNLHFTCCGVDDLYQLEKVEEMLNTLKHDYVVFREPDIGNTKTAIGVYPIVEHKKGLLKNYKLLQFSK